MPRSHTVQLRMSNLELAELDEVARGLGMSRSDLLREGIKQMRRHATRLQARQSNIHLLLQAAEEVPGDEVRFEGRP